MSESNLEYLVNCRKFARKRVTEIHTSSATFDRCSESERLAIKGKLNELLSNLKEYDYGIQLMKFNNDYDNPLFVQELEKCDDYKSKVIGCLAVLESMQSGSNFSSNHNPYSSSNLLKCPTAPLPKYGGSENEDITKFFFTFEEILNKYNYGDFEKLLLLKQQTSGKALLLINTLETENLGYSNAKDLLLKALASNDIQINNTIRSLSDLNMTEYEEPFEYFSKFKFVLENIDKLNITVDQIVRYFIWYGMPDSFKKILTSITNKTWPTLEDIKSNYFTACERYSPKQKRVAKSTDMAVNVSTEKSKVTKSFPCSLCAYDKIDSDHPLMRCSKYSTVSSKIEKLLSVNGCTKCAFTNHVKDNCRFKFKNKCMHCQGYHWSYLCEKETKSSKSPDSKPPKTDSKPVKNPKKPDLKTEKTKNQTNSNSVNSDSNSAKIETSNGITTITEVQSSLIEEGTILPTFTGECQNQLIRVMKDGGSQSNFISSVLASKLNLRVIDGNVELTINGINSKKKYQTKLVEFELKVGENISKIKALCLPSIDIRLSLPNLPNIVEIFKSKGYVLADRFIGNNEILSDIEIIIGSKSGHVIPETEITFGLNNESVYSNTHAGVLLKGEVNSLLQDLHYLDCKTESSSVSLMSVNQIPLVSSGSKLHISNFEFPKSKIISNVLNDEGQVKESDLMNAASQILENTCGQVIGKDPNKYSEENVEVNQKIIQFALDNTTRREDGRLIMPILWNPRCSHLLSKNFNLSKQILMNILKKHENGKINLKIIDEIFKDQEKQKIIERIPDLSSFIEEHPEHSFLPYMTVTKPDRETTKVRIVFLSNLSEKSKLKPSLSHNQAILPGPPLNQKLSSAIMHLRFGEKICCFDLRKAFLQIDLPEYDRNRLLFLWFKNIDLENYEVIGFRSCRLPFGLRCSPVILMLALYKLLILDTSCDSDRVKNLKRIIYQLSYMDNCGFVAESTEELVWMFNQVKDIFSAYKFDLQQFVTNDEILRQKIQETEETKENEAKTKLLGLEFDQISDKIKTKPISLNKQAETKREILSTIASQFDLLGFNTPLMNRSRLFMHNLQCRSDIDWDDKLSSSELNEWKNIANQGNSAIPLEFDRNFGSRNDIYQLICFTDSSKLLFGIVLYILNINTKKLSFVLSRNKIINKQLESKSIPSLELQAISLAVENVIDVKNELSGLSCVDPIHIKDCIVYSDSYVALAWLNSYAMKIDKQKQSTFVANRLEYITKLCENEKVTFKFVSGDLNPADLVTRPVSHKVLVKTNFINGPKFLTSNTVSVEQSHDDLISFTLPNPSYTKGFVYSNIITNDLDKGNTEHLIPLNKFSSFNKLARVHEKVLFFCNKLKLKIKLKYPGRYDHLKVENDSDLYQKACRQILITDQKLYFSDVINYFNSNNKTIKYMPNLIKQLNLYIDCNGIIRMRSKCDRMKEIKKLGRYNFPILISKKSLLSKCLILDYHQKMSHAGCYTVLAELRKDFWITHAFMTVKKIIKDCLICRRFNSKPISLNQSPYRDFRLSPENIPYRQIYIDFIGPFKIKKENGETGKVWLLILTCLWSRAVNLKICPDLSTKEFLMSFQLHCYEYGMPSLCISDLGSQIVSGTNIISSFIDDYETKSFLKENGIENVEFQQYFKGASQLGSIVESCVKLTKRLLFGAIKNYVLKLREFEFVVAKTVNIINKRPVAFKEVLRDNSGDEIPEAITPEMLLYGREIISTNIIPELQPTQDSDVEWSNVNVEKYYEKLCKIKENISNVYYDEFVGNLICQSINKNDRYKPIKHNLIKPGDIVMLKETYSKPNSFPLARVKEIKVNSLGEITGAIVLKSRTNETVKRHSSTIIPFLEIDDYSDDRNNDDNDSSTNTSIDVNRKQRKAALKSRKLTKQILDED